MNGWLINPLRLGTKAELKAEEGTSPDVLLKMTLGRQLALYGTLVFGNTASNFLDAYRSGLAWHPSFLALVFALVVGVVLLPGAIDANKLNGQKEELVQFAMIFTYGMGWQSLLGAAIKAVGG